VIIADYDVAVVGAGPYGLSAAAHLKAAGLGVRVFGEPMEFWANKMPDGMLLRSPREASTVSDPKGTFTLEAYEANSNTKPVAPLPRETFVQYGKWFCQHLGSDLDRSAVVRVGREGSLFRVALENGTSLTTRRVVVAAGIEPFQRRPRVFANFTPQHVSHCYEGRKLPEFRGKRVAVIGAGQSALECAALLHETGSNVEVIALIPSLRWIGKHVWLHRLGPISRMLYSKHDVGPAGISRLVAAPHLVYHLPLSIKDRIRKRAVRPAGAKWLPDRLSAVKISLGRVVQSAKPIGDQALLMLDDGSQRQVDHVLLGTGYDVDIARYRFLAPDLVKQVRQLDGYPDLTYGFRSSVPGLHFIGATAARSFGPLLYFVAGTGFASTRLTAHIRHHWQNVQ
jgi:lysine/ornithine N-monooxygenase